MGGTLLDVVDKISLRIDSVGRRARALADNLYALLVWTTAYAIALPLIAHGRAKKSRIPPWPVCLWLAVVLLFSAVAGACTVAAVLTQNHRTTVIFVLVLIASEIALFASFACCRNAPDPRLCCSGAQDGVPLLNP